MITIPFLPSYTIALSTRQEGTVRTRDKIQELLLPYQLTREVGLLPLLHGSHRVRWMDHATDEAGDAVLTNSENLAASMVVGDCFPIILIDQRKHAIALIHGGWRSLLQNILDLTMIDMQQAFKSDPKDIYVWIGPGLRKESNVFPEKPVQATFCEWQQFVEKTPTGYCVDLVAYISTTLSRNGIPTENIFDYGKDTYSDAHAFFSHRRSVLEQDEDGRFMVCVWKN